MTGTKAAVSVDTLSDFDAVALSESGRDFVESEEIVIFVLQIIAVILHFVL